MSSKDQKSKEEDLFDLGFDDDSDDESSQVQRVKKSYTKTEILPNTQMIGGGGRSSNIHGSNADFVGGRASSPLLFSQASSFPECSQLRAWKIVNGIPTGLGVIDSNATEEDFVLQFRNAMPKEGEQKAIFKLRPLDIDGQELGQEISIVISEHHASLQQNKISKEQKLLQELAPQKVDLHNSMVDMLRETLNASQRALEEERLRTQQLMSQMAQERIDLASNTASGIQMITERMLNADAQRQETMLKQERERNRQAQDNMASFFQSNLEVLQGERDRASQQADLQMQRDKTFYERMMEQQALQREQERSETRQRLEMMKLEAQAERERLRQEWQMKVEQEDRKRLREQQEWDQRLQRMRQEYELKREAEKEEYERRERERRREAEEKRIREARDQKEKDSERARQHEMKMRELELSAQRDKEHSERMMQLQLLQFENQKKEGIGGIKNIIKETKKTLEEFGIDPRDIIDRFTGNDGGTTGSEVISALTKIAGNATEVMKEGIRAKAMENAPQPPPQMYPPNPYAPPNMYYPYSQGQAQQPQIAPPQATEPQRQSDSQKWMAQNQQTQNQQQELNMDLKSQRAARKAMRSLVSTLKQTQDADWEELITYAITNEFSIYHYCNAVSVEHAVAEAGGDENFTEKLIAKLRESPLVPDDMRMRK